MYEEIHMWLQARRRVHGHLEFTRAPVREHAASVDEADLPAGIPQAVAVESWEEWLIAFHWWPPPQRLPVPDGDIFLFFL